MKSPLVLLQQTSCDWEVPTDSLPSSHLLSSGVLSETLLKQESRPLILQLLIDVATVRGKLDPLKRTPQCGHWWLGLTSYFQLCWLYRKATLLSRCDRTLCARRTWCHCGRQGHQHARFHLCRAVAHCTRGEWPGCSKLTANGEKES